MRKSEIFTITWKNIKINEIFRWGGITVIGKGKKQRTIRINKSVYNLLICKSEEKVSQYVFPSKKTGKHLTDVKHPFTSALKKPVFKISDFMIYVILQQFLYRQMSGHCPQTLITHCLTIFLVSGECTVCVPHGLPFPFFGMGDHDTGSSVRCSGNHNQSATFEGLQKSCNFLT